MPEISHYEISYIRDCDGELVVSTAYSKEEIQPHVNAAQLVARAGTTILVTRDYKSEVELKLEL